MTEKNFTFGPWVPLAYLVKMSPQERRTAIMRAADQRHNEWSPEQLEEWGVPSSHHSGWIESLVDLGKFRPFHPYRSGRAR